MRAFYTSVAGTRPKTSRCLDGQARCSIMAPMPKVADVLVVGLGAVGRAALYQSAKLGARAIGIDRFDPPHDQGSSHGDTRITREAIGEGR